MSYIYSQNEPIMFKEMDATKQGERRRQTSLVNQIRTSRPNKEIEL